jgi:hypothetical protein
MTDQQMALPMPQEEKICLFVTPEERRLFDAMFQIDGFAIGNVIAGEKIREFRSSIKKDAFLANMLKAGIMEATGDDCKILIGKEQMIFEPIDSREQIFVSPEMFKRVEIVRQDKPKFGQGAQAMIRLFDLKHHGAAFLFKECARYGVYIRIDDRFIYASPVFSKYKIATRNLKKSKEKSQKKVAPKNAPTMATTEGRIIVKKQTLSQQLRPILLKLRQEHDNVVENLNGIDGKILAAKDAVQDIFKLSLDEVSKQLRAKTDDFNELVTSKNTLTARQKELAEALIHFDYVVAKLEKDPEFGQTDQAVEPAPVENSPAIPTATTLPENQTVEPEPTIDSEKLKKIMTASLTPIQRQLLIVDFYYANKAFEIGDLSLRLSMAGYPTLQTNAIRMLIDGYARARKIKLFERFERSNKNAILLYRLSQAGKDALGELKKMF